MSLRHLFVCCIALTVISLSSCSKKDVADKKEKPAEGVHDLDMSGETESKSPDAGTNQQQEDAKSKGDEQSRRIPAMLLETPGAQDEVDESVAENDPGREEFVVLRKEQREKTNAWRKSMAGAKSREEQRELAGNNPGKEYAEKFLELAEKYPGTNSASGAYTIALQFGAPDTKKKAMQKLMALIEANPESPGAQASLMVLCTNGSGEIQTNAMNRLLDNIEQDLTSDDSFNQLKTLINVRGDSPAKARTVQLVNKLIDLDINSDKAVESLGLMANSRDAKISSPALEKLFEHHADNEVFIGVIKGLAGKVSQESQDFLLKVCEEGTGEVKATAVLTLAQFYGRRDLMAQFYADAAEEQLKSLPPEMVAFMKAEREMGESDRLEDWLTNFESEDEELVQQAANQLFALLNLSIGKTAPEITAEDLDGKEFNLSDYRGKVVFLDFWGDW